MEARGSLAFRSASLYFKLLFSPFSLLYSNRLEENKMEELVEFQHRVVLAFHSRRHPAREFETAPESR